jgi:phospholipid-binding lipoprotein MlaA
MKTKTRNSLLNKLILIFSLAILSACASVPGGPSENDPFESYNRAMFSFNDGLDKYFLRPVAEGYDKVLPKPVKTGVSNIFSHIGDVFVILNDILQFKFTQTIEDIGRFVFNSTFGLYGLIDVATPMGLPKHYEDFGQTLATWGVGSGPYIVLPFLGPSTIRGTAGEIVAISSNPINSIPSDDVRLGTAALSVVDARYKLLKASRIVDQAALDEYSFVRDAYLQYRKNLIYDGNPPEEDLTPPPESSADDLDLENLLELELK